MSEASLANKEAGRHGCAGAADAAISAMTGNNRLVRAISGALEACLYSATIPSYRFLGWLLGFIFAGASIAMLCLGAAPIAGPWDVVSLLNAGWRIINGQIPHIDYHNPIGPLTYVPIVIGMKIGGVCTAAIVYGSVLLLVCFVPWAWKMAAARFPPFIAFIFVLFCGFLLISPRPLGFAIRETTYAMIYNREGYFLLSLLLIVVFLPSREAGKSGAVLDGLSTGLLLGLLFYCKVTYFAVGVASTVLGIAMKPRTGKWFFEAAVGLAVVSVALRLFFHIHPTAYIADIITAGHSQLPAMRLQLLKQALSSNLTWLYLSLLLVGLWSRVDETEAKTLLSRTRLWLIAGWILGMALFIESGNAAQRGGVEDPLFFVAGLIILESFRRQNKEQVQTAKSPARLVYAAHVWVVLPLFCGTIMAADSASFAYASAWDLLKRPSFPGSRRIHAQGLRDLLVPESTQHLTSYWPAREFPLRINEGLDLLGKILTKGDKVTTIGFTDPFSLAFGLPPALDGNQWWDVNFSFDLKRHPSPEQFLGDVSLVMVPRRVAGVQGWNFDSEDAMLELYGNYLHSHFREFDSSEAWTLYRRQ